MRLWFDNGYGASIIDDGYGAEHNLVEVAVLVRDDANPNGCRIVTDTPVTGDVIGWLDEIGLCKVLEQIKALPPVALDDKEGQP